jgi:hypothetical protein
MYGYFCDGADPLKDVNMDGIIETLIGVSKGCLSSACELAQRSISQLLTLRKDTTSKQLSIEKVRIEIFIILVYISILILLSISSRLSSCGR